MTLADCKHGTIVKIGATTYRLYRLSQCDNGVLGTMANFAGVQECKQREDGSWWDDHTVPRRYRHWRTDCEIVDDSNTAVSGEVWDTRTGKLAAPPKVAHTLIDVPKVAHTMIDVPNYVPAIVVDPLGSLRVLMRIDDFVFTVYKDGRSILPVPGFPKDYELTELPVFAKAFSQDTPQPSTESGHVKPTG